MEPTLKLEQPTLPEMQELLRRATPGPWRVRVGDEGWMHIVGPDRQDITDIGDMEDITTEDAWNGKLIAAAPDLARLALSLHDQLQQERAEATGLREALVKMTRQHAAEAQAHDGTVDSRDRAHEAADRLAYALYSVDEIGEHTNLNDPWVNAAERLEALPQQLQQEREARERVEVALSWYADVIARKLALNAELPGS